MGWLPRARRPGEPVGEVVGDSDRAVGPGEEAAGAGVAGVPSAAAASPSLLLGGGVAFLLLLLGLPLGVPGTRRGDGV